MLAPAFSWVPLTVVDQSLGSTVALSAGRFPPQLAAAPMASVTSAVHDGTRVALYPSPVTYSHTDFGIYVYVHGTGTELGAQKRTLLCWGLEKSSVHSGSSLDAIPVLHTYEHGFLTNLHTLL